MYASPFFAPQFTAAVATARGDARVAVLEEAGAIVGFFPFHRAHRSRGSPIGTKLNDYQGLIVRPSVDWEPTDVVRRSGLRSFSFDHLIADQVPFRPYLRSVEPSPALDLSAGYEAYLASQRSLGHGGPRDAMLKRRRLERAHTLRLEVDKREGSALKELLRLKSDHYRRTRTFDAFSLPWVVEVVERLHGTHTRGFAGVLSTLYADDVLIAGHFGLRAGPVLHYWFPAYDPGWGKYSPGSVLLLGMAEELSRRGVSTLDLGKGWEPYKERFTNGGAELGIGSVEVGRTARLRGRASGRAWSIALRSPLYRPLYRLRRRRQFGA